MYSNIGQKIKKIGIVLGCLLLTIGIIAWFYLITNGSSRSAKEDDVNGWLALLMGILGFVLSWFIYGFGKLVEDVGAIRQHLESANRTDTPVGKREQRKCIVCGIEQDVNEKYCQFCGYKF